MQLRVYKTLNKMNKLFFLLFLFLTKAGLAQLVYVDDAIGNDGNNGTSLATPWKTIQYAMDNAAPGNTVLIRTGTYYEALQVNVSGTAGNAITFKNYNNENVYIDGNNTAITLLYIADQSNLVIQGLVFQNTLGNNSAGVVIEGNCATIVFKKNKIRNINWTASAAKIPSSTNNSNPFLVYGNNASNAINNIVIDSNEVSNNITGFSESLTLDGNINGFSITNNSVHDNLNIGILCAGNYLVSSNPATDNARNGSVKNNVVYNCVSNYATSGGIYIDGGKTIIVEKNKVYGNGYGIEIGAEELGTTSAITVRDNLIFDNTIAGLAIGGYNFPSTGQVIDCIIENNTFVKNDNTNSGNGEIVISKASNCIFRNNILYTNTQNIPLSSSYDLLQSNLFNYNAYYAPSGVAANLSFVFNNTTYSGLAAFQSSVAQEANGIFVDPLLTNTILTAPSTVDFSLSTGSLCIDAGNPLHMIVSNEVDYYNFNRIANSIIDIGAIEYGSTPTSTMNSLANNPMLTVYPNPFTETVSLKYSALFLPTKLAVYNELGIEVFVKNKDFNVEELNLTQLPKGLYLLKIYTETDFYSYKIVKQ